MKKIILTFSVLLFACLIIVGFMTIDDPGTRSQNTQQSIQYPIVVNGPALDGPLSTLSESFEGVTFPPAGWTKITPTTGAGYNRQTAGTTPVPGFQGGTMSVPVGGGTALGFCNYITGTAGGLGSGLSDQWLITPQITNVQPNDSLTFWIWKFGNYKENMIVRLSTTTPTVAGMSIRIDSIGFAAADSGWVQKKYRIGNLVPAGSNIYIGFREWVTSADVDGASLGLDLVNVTASAPPVTLSWTEQVSPIATELYSVSAVDDNVAWACGTGGKVLRTTNKGVTWSDVTGNIPATALLYNIFAWDANTALTTASPTAGNYIYKTSNGGANWTQVNFQTGGFGNALWMTDANTAYQVGDPVGGNWTFLKSTNGGDNWSTWATVPTTAAGWNNSLMILGNNVWMGTNANYLMYSSNLGANWSQQTTTFTNQYAVWFNSATVGLAAYTALNVTTNSGTNWSALASPLATSVGGITGTGNEWWVAPQSTAIYYSSNNGTVWSTAYTAPDGLYRHITKARTGNTIWAVRSNGKISRYGTPITGITVVGSEIPSSYAVSQNFPNPFNPTTKINFALPKSGLVTMKVYDILGKEVATLVNEVKNAGSYTVDFNASNLTSGMYFYKVSVNGFSEVKKMMLIK
ncbi:MAG: T9SS type A sorting domain-containing protein [Candidatus Kapaibacterium sp.]